MAITRFAETVWNGDLLTGLRLDQLRLVGLVHPPPGHLGLADRGARRPHQPGGADRLGARVVLLDGVQRRARHATARRPPGWTSRPWSRSTRGDAGWRITRSDLTVRGVVPGIDAAKFAELADGAKDGCPVSQALKGNVDLSVEATLAE